MMFTSLFFVLSNLTGEIFLKLLYDKIESMLTTIIESNEQLFFQLTFLKMYANVS